MSPGSPAVVGTLSSTAATRLVTQTCETYEALETAFVRPAEPEQMISINVAVSNLFSVSRSHFNKKLNVFKDILYNVLVHFQLTLKYVVSM